jgi:hypothetical protein
MEKQHNEQLEAVKTNFARARLTTEMTIPEVTVLHYGLESHEREMLERVMQRLSKENRWGEKSTLNLLEARHSTDIVALDFFVGFVDFAQLTESEREIVFGFYADEIQEQDEESLDRQRVPHHQQLIAALNVKNGAVEICSRTIRALRTWFSSDESLRKFLLDRLHITTKNERRKASHSRTNRIQRLLTMYQLLLKQGWITVDDFNRKYPEMKMSQSTYEKDIKELRMMEDYFLEYNIENKRHQLL